MPAPLLVVDLHGEADGIDIDVQPSSELVRISVAEELKGQRVGVELAVLVGPVERRATRSA
jgi:hypothetical protein